jgi:hypothetical protein
MALGALLVLYGIVYNVPGWKLCALSTGFVQNRKLFLLLGFLAGINLCPPFLIALSYSLTLGTPWRGMLFFFFFYISTSVFILPFLFSSLISRFHAVRSAARITAVLAGLWFVYLGVKNIFLIAG